MSTLPLIVVEDLAKTFVLHNADSASIPVFERLSLEVSPGECVVLAGESGVGKSTLMRSIYGNYLPTQGSVRVLHDGAYVDITQALPHQVLDVRRRTLGYVSQFLRVIPRISTLQLIMEPLLENGVSTEEAQDRAETLLSALRLPRAHWELPPATFSGGEQQRVNIARSFIRNYPVMLLDEPTASLDAENRAIVVTLIQQALARGAAMIGIFHDHDVRDAVATRLFGVSEFKAAA
ncbi:MAG: phosphonate C-P lyase system protein PhnL [Phenylobacterium sp.]|uniref:phosphonate C-P lyase system protein PhnL n=1 Tax=Phenylobacterium sp. TaxID=1871053 RepID=UPI002728F722|nr:phosphonate C-P lyase system protein PhnL [Phenylobacterium sp.]MDO8910620.1 phosphonate C-P lyase system protein PhnL [Phenylobacterium sp.]MDP2011341.1 phosphonate C-P lyase system protein PhnL [Phenylobacterium sp.]MDP3102303.1 phosphonate C-P lyase system protein PhnL [Phenylobacterium sp.]